MKMRFLFVVLAVLLGCAVFAEARFRLKFPKYEFGLENSALNDRISRSINSISESRSKRGIAQESDFESSDDLVLSLLEEQSLIPNNRGEGVA
uniref:Venom peptide n=1 Tax=Panagrellus redivivus TaxID=6233 RepID=A0A7E4ZR35_PANRE